jgi:hypothetical protein
MSPGTIWNPLMSATPKSRQRGPWTPEEIAREERATRARAARDRHRTPEERLQETVRVGRFISELARRARGKSRP